ncbi:hypothetical protein GCM10017562_67010 [Streptomyces roseofulvus]
MTGKSGASAVLCERAGINASQESQCDGVFVQTEVTRLPLLGNRVSASPARVSGRAVRQRGISLGQGGQWCAE